MQLSVSPRGAVAVGGALALVAALSSQPPPPAPAGPAASTSSSPGAPAPAGAREAERAALAEADRAFARVAREKGVRESFMTFLTDDAILFRPGPVAGKEWLRGHPEPQVQLLRRAALVEVSAAGDLGYSTGPYEARPAADAGPERAQTSYGHYVTLWKRQPDGSWKGVLDIGVEGPPNPAALAAGVPAGPPAERANLAPGPPPTPPSPTPPVADKPQPPAPGSPPPAQDAAREEARADLLATDRAFDKVSLSQGTRAAYLAHLAEGARLIRESAPPLVGREAIRRAFGASQKPELLTWQPVGAEVSRSGDLGYTYGVAGVKEDGPQGMTSDLSNYLRVWERQKEGQPWKVVLDLFEPKPPPAPPVLLPPSGPRP